MFKFNIILIVAQTAAFICVLLKLRTMPSPPVKKHDRTHILILSSWRSGSSFTGQLFSQHPDVFYLMEPGWHVWSALHQNGHRVLHMSVRDLLRSAFLCDMSVFDAYMGSEKIKSTLFQWETSRALCSPPACESFKRSDIIPQEHCRILCSKYPFETVEEACKTYNHIVLKEVRIFDIKVLYSLLRDPSLNLKIIHLVRDPRGVFHSRQRLTRELGTDSDIVMQGLTEKDEDKEYQVMQEICKSQAEMYLNATRSNFKGLRRRYFAVRYEDIVNEPVLMAELMYRFAKLDFTPKLKSWIYNITHGEGHGHSFVINPRNALNVSMAWRYILPFNTTEKIQNICASAMDVFGYKDVKSEEEQKNVSLDLLLPGPK
ncbi:carbohydrate sulfotransferase 4-like [Spea bombifrons]|uniref:carbohydrate sulfotransferase 4-like n=1 Tax=Spea bombifrons TaxID=233779 RepID=UPI0023496032|nr:carbohydrate sulfotransferase 4-like [Spea bombifrons]